MMSLGARGVISVVSNIVPAAMSRLANDCLQGNYPHARELHYELFDLMRAMFIDNNPTAVKTAASILGLCTVELRLPLTPMSAGQRDRVAGALARCAFTRTPVAA